MTSELLWLSAFLALWVWTEGRCSSATDINIWQTSGICVNSEKDMTECGTQISNVFVSDEVRPFRMANCLETDRGWKLSSDCMLCFGRLMDCTAEHCPIVCFQGGASSEPCRTCVTNACNKVGADHFDFPNCSRTSHVDPSDLTNCTAPPTTIIPGLDDEVFFSIVGAGGVVAVAGLFGIGKYGCRDSDDLDSTFDDAEIRRDIKFQPPGSSYPSASVGTGSYTKPPPPLATQQSSSSIPQLFGSARNLNTSSPGGAGPAKIIINGEVYKEDTGFGDDDGDDDVDDTVF